MIDVASGARVERPGPARFLAGVRERPRAERPRGLWRARVLLLIVAALLVPVIVAGPAGAAPTGTLPNPAKVATQTTGDKIIGTASTLATVSPWGRAFKAVRWGIGAAQAYQQGQSLLSYIEGSLPGGGSMQKDQSTSENGAPHTSPNDYRCDNKIQLGSASQWDSPLTGGAPGTTKAVRFAVSYEPTKTPGDASDGSNLCRSDPDGSGPAAMLPKTVIRFGYYCTDAAGALVKNPPTATAFPDQPTRYTSASYELWSNYGGLGGRCPAGGGVALAEWGPSGICSNGVCGQSYYFPGNGQWVAPGFDPDRVRGTITVVTCRNVTTQSEFTVEGGYMPDEGPDLDRPIVQPTCPEGSVAIAQSTFEQLAGQGARTLLERTTIDVPKIQQDYPGCYPAGCELAVYVDGKRCEVGSECWDWKKLANDRLRCGWGAYTMPLSDCDELAEQYKTGTVGINPKTGQRVATDVDGKPDPNAAPGTSAPPAPNPAPQPQPQPTPTPEPPGVPNPDKPETQPDPDGAGNCFAAAISWNPIDWVYVPVKCALTWAFVPKTNTLQRAVEGVRAPWDASWPGTALADVGGMMAGFPVGAGGGCQGPGFTVSMALVGGGSHTLHPFSACSQPMATVAAVVKIALTVSFYMACSFLTIKLVLGAFGWQLPNSWGSRGQNV